MAATRAPDERSIVRRAWVVAKVRGVGPQVEVSRRVFAQIARQSLPFATPLILVCVSGTGLW